MSDVSEETCFGSNLENKAPFSGEGRGPLARVVVIAILLRLETTHKNYLLNVHFPKY